MRYTIRAKGAAGRVDFQNPLTIDLPASPTVRLPT